MKTVLVIDDEASIRSAIQRGFPDYEVLGAESGHEGLELIVSHEPDVVLLDLKLKGGSGLELLPAIAARPTPPHVIVITAYGSVRSTVEALRKGAYDYVEKPFDLDALKVSIDNALKLRDLEAEVDSLRARVARLSDDGQHLLLGDDPKVVEIRNLVRRVAKSDCPVLILGASGTGKELVARSLHAESDRKNRPLVVVNCAALPEHLAESELFGHEKGAFTGAVSRVRGRFERAEDGTIFLDEIGDLKPELQAKLLRVIEDGGFERVGGSRTLRCEARIVTATHRDLETVRDQVGFRDDLYYRLSTVVVRLPPLASRRDDIPLLCGHFLERYRKEKGCGPRELSEEALEALRRHAFPGNVRELKNAIERACLLAEGDEIQVYDLPDAIGAAIEPSQPCATQEIAPLKQQVEGFERRAIERALATMDGHRANTARCLGISLRALQYKLSRYGIR